MVRQGRYVPRRGDAAWLNLDPQSGHEQAGRRPVLVLSPASYNARIGLALVCPVTRQAKGYPFEVALPEGSSISGVVLADQVKSMDWRARDAALIGPVPDDVVGAVLDRLAPLLSIEP
ncbi:MAG TPA: endoribonuclease MazF [Longimicrobiales bacterium]